jgi:hypothetical protein
MINTILMRAIVTRMIVPCDAPFRVLFFTQQTSPPRTSFLTFSATRRISYLSKGEEAVLHIFNDLHNYQINFISLLNIFENTDRLRSHRKARAVFRWPSPLEKGGMRLLYFTHPKCILTGIIANATEIIIE